MRKTLGGVFVLVLALTLVLVPAPVSAGFGDDCTWDPVKWEDNENSWNLYLMHWGRTPVTAMSRLAGLCGPDAICGDAFGLDCPADPNTCTMGGCCGCRDAQEGFLAGCSDPVQCTDSKSGEACVKVGMIEEECPAQTIYGDAKCAACWGISLCFANKSWAGADIGAHPRVDNDHPNHRGNSAGGGSNYGGDWGLSGCPHTECITQTWCLQDNLLANPHANK